MSREPLEITLQLKMELSELAECSINITVHVSSIAEKEKKNTTHNKMEKDFIPHNKKNMKHTGIT